MTLSRQQFYNSIAYHKITPDSHDIARQFQNLRQAAQDFGHIILNNTTEYSREQEQALIHVEEALMWATKQVAVSKLPIAEPLN